MSDRKSQFEDYLDGVLHQSEVDDLQSWIQSDSDNALQFLQWTIHEGHIADYLQMERYQQVLRSSGGLGGMVDEVLSSGVRVESSSQADQELPKNHRTVKQGRGKHTNWSWSIGAASALAATIAAALLVAVSLLPQWLPANQQQAASEVNETTAAAHTETVGPQQGVHLHGDGRGLLAQADTVAMLTALVDPIWSEPANPMERGQPLKPGEVIELTSGIAKIAFESGAEVVLQAPFRFVVENPMQGKLAFGNLSAKVPRRASGFVVQSAMAEVVDLGTEFGFSVAKSGESEVHVFSGEVISRRLDASGEEDHPSIRLNQRDGLRFEAGKGPPVRITADERKFVRSASRGLTPEQATMLPVKTDLALWLAADFSVERDQDGRVVAWRDAICGDNTSAEDALQLRSEARPEYVLDAINGLPALRFDGKKTFLVTTPLATHDNQTVLIVCQFSRSSVENANRPGGQILNYNGPPHRIFSTTYEPGVLQIGEPILHDFAPTRIRAKVYAGERGGVGVSEGRIVSPAVGASRPVVVSYIYDNDANRSVLSINGRQLETGSARSPAGVVSRKVLGRHGFDKLFFAGDLAEILIFNRALTDDNVVAITEYLGDKYNIRVHRTN